MRIPRVPDKIRIPPGNARWAALTGGVLVLSVMLAVIIGTKGWFGFDSGDAGGGRRVDATVVTGAPCGQGTEVVRFQLDGREREATFDGCGHQEGEPVQVTVPSNAADAVVRAADATTGEGDNDRRLGLLLLVLSGLAGAGFALLGKPEFLARLGPLRPGDLRPRRRS